MCQARKKRKKSVVSANIFKKDSFEKEIIIQQRCQDDGN